ncbi:unnamed protein product [Ilex paraguariensis]|uniref:Uncharacterized protein n=1 Tax=Ilex paraguariensis TaxID=185542 RepID=A0ABC8V4P1_9AQUA
MSNLDMSLDDMIKKNKKSNPRGRSRSSGAPGPNRRPFKRSANRTTPYSTGTVQAPDDAWDHGMFAEHAAAYPAQVSRVSAIETGTKLVISNLDYGVSNEDIKVVCCKALEFYFGSSFHVLLLGVSLFSN